MFLARSRSLAHIEQSQNDFKELMDKLRDQKADFKAQKKFEEVKKVTEFRNSNSPKRSISPEGHSPWKRSKIINEDFEPIVYENMGKISGDVLRYSSLKLNMWLIGMQICFQGATKTQG